MIKVGDKVFLTVETRRNMDAMDDSGIGRVTDVVDRRMGVRVEWPGGLCRWVEPAWLEVAE